MQYEILYQPEFSVVKIMLEANEQISAESGAMMSMTPNIDVQSKVPGGIGKMIGRMVAGESAFQTTFTAQGGAGEVILAPGFPGDIVAVDASQPLMVTGGAYLAGDINLQMETITSLKGFVGGEGLFMLKIFGQGLLLLGSYGAIHAVQLAPGQSYIVDTGHLVAFTASMGFNIKKAAKGLMSTITSGEGLVAEMTGPGIVYTQTRTVSALAAAMPVRR